MGARHIVYIAFAVIAASAASMAQAQSLPEGPGKDTFENTCSVCHSPIAVVGMHKTKEEWKMKVAEMLQQQTDVSDADVATIVDYLARSFPATVNVNKAMAMDLETIAGLSSKDAAAIVQYREAKGNFKSLDDLKKVPGVDAAKLDASKQFFEFQ